VKKLLVALAVIAVLFVGAWLLVRNRLRAAIEQRFAATLDADCDVDGLSLHFGGASANGIHVSAKAGALQGDIDAIEADFRWLALLTSKPQAIAVRIVHPQVREALPVGNVALALKNMGQGKHPDGTPSSITLDKLTVTDGEVDVKVSLFASAQVHGISIAWAPRSPLEVTWTDAGIESMLGGDGTGPCTIKTPPGGHIADVECPKIKLNKKVDLEKVKSLSDLSKIFLKEPLP